MAWFSHAMPLNALNQSMQACSFSFLFTLIVFVAIPLHYIYIKDCVRNSTLLEIKMQTRKMSQKHNYTDLSSEKGQKYISFQSGLERFQFVRNPSFICQVDVFLLVAVHSSANNFKLRESIRQTWGSINRISQHKVRTVFLLARKPNLEIQDAIANESNKHKDIIQGDFIDHYRNLTLKNVMGLKWISEYCPTAKNVIKVDDDVFLNVPQAISFLTENSYLKIGSDMIHCPHLLNVNPIRDTNYKWFVTTKEFPGHKYPLYCEGFGYILGTNLCRRLYKASTESNIFWIDDVFVTGILTQKLGDVKHIPLKWPYGYKVITGTGQNISTDAMFFLMHNQQREKEMYALWLRLNQERHL